MTTTQTPTTVALRVGSIVRYVAFGGVERLTRITALEPDIKNGRPGFDGVVILGPEQGLAVWGYLDQIASVAGA